MSTNSEIFQEVVKNLQKGYSVPLNGVHKSKLTFSQFCSLIEKHLPDCKDLVKWTVLIGRRKIMFPLSAFLSESKASDYVDLIKDSFLILATEDPNGIDDMYLATEADREWLVEQLNQNNSDLEDDLYDSICTAVETVFKKTNLENIDDQANLFRDQVEKSLQDYLRAKKSSLGGLHEEEERPRRWKGKKPDLIV